jgi:hypothetical protein
MASGASHCIKPVDLTAAIVRAKGARRRRLFALQGRAAIAAAIDDFVFTARSSVQSTYISYGAQGTAALKSSNARAATLEIRGAMAESRWLA